MDEMRALDPDHDGGMAEPALDEPGAAIGTDERRMHVRAYNFWVSLLAGRAYPAIDDLDPAAAGDFGDHAVLLDFTRDEADPAITYIGEALRRACGIDGAIETVADVPGGTLLSRLTDHYLQILANRAPIGFEAEFVDQQDAAMLYRGILMPFSSDGEHIDHVYGVINWKAIAAAADIGAPTPPAIPAAAARAAAIAWADGPGGLLAYDMPVDQAPAIALDDRLAAAREAATRAEATWIDCRGARHRALCLAHGFMLAAEEAPDDYAALRAAAGIVDGHAEAAAVALVFGVAGGGERHAEFADVLAGARRLGIAAGALARHLDGERGGTRALIAAERARRAATEDARARTLLRAAPAATRLPELAADDEFALLLARRGPEGKAEIVGRVADPSPLVADAIRIVAHASGTSA